MNPVCRLSLTRVSGFVLADITLNTAGRTKEQSLGRVSVWDSEVIVSELIPTTGTYEAVTWDLSL